MSLWLNHWELPTQYISDITAECPLPYPWLLARSQEKQRVPLIRSQGWICRLQRVLFDVGSDLTDSPGKRVRAVVIQQAINRYSDKIMHMNKTALRRAR
jgi:hypothetical protein